MMELDEGFEISHTDSMMHRLFGHVGFDTIDNDSSQEVDDDEVTGGALAEVLSTQKERYNDDDANADDGSIDNEKEDDFWDNEGFVNDQYSSTNHKKRYIRCGVGLLGVVVVCFIVFGSGKTKRAEQMSCPFRYIYIYICDIK